MTGNCGEQWTPHGVAWQSENMSYGIEQTQPSCTVIVIGSQRGGIFVKAIRKETRNLGLEFLGEFTNVMQAEKKTDQRNDDFLLQIEQVGNASSESMVALDQFLSDSRNIEAVICKRMPIGTGIRITWLSLSPKS